MIKKWVHGLWASSGEPRFVVDLACAGMTQSSLRISLQCIAQPDGYSMWSVQSCLAYHGGNFTFAARCFAATKLETEMSIFKVPCSRESAQQQVQADGWTLLEGAFGAYGLCK